jgi:hypothetical protein
LTFLSGVAILSTCLIFGGIALVFPLSFLGWFSFILIIYYLNAKFQLSVTPGLQNLKNPNIWLSAVGNAYLYATNRKRWTWYVSWIAFLLGFVGMTLIGFIVVERVFTSDVITPLGANVGWLSGVFFSLSVTLTLNALVSKDKL